VQATKEDPFALDYDYHYDKQKAAEAQRRTEARSVNSAAR